MRLYRYKITTAATPEADDPPSVQTSIRALPGCLGTLEAAVRDNRTRIPRRVATFLGKRATRPKLAVSLHGPQSTHEPITNQGRNGQRQEPSPEDALDHAQIQR